MDLKQKVEGLIVKYKAKHQTETRIANDFSERLNHNPKDPDYRRWASFHSSNAHRFKTILDDLNKLLDI